MTCLSPTANIIPKQGSTGGGRKRARSSSLASSGNVRVRGRRRGKIGHENVNDNTSKVQVSVLSLAYALFF